MLYLIDGYNLLFRVLRTSESLQKQRNHLITDIEQGLRLLKINVAIVFDSQYQPSEGSRHHLGDLEIIYTDKGETADEFILKKVKEAKKPEGITVVTSDKILANQCRYRLAKTLPVDEFLVWVEKRQKNILAEKKEKPKLIVRPIIPPPPVKVTPEQPKEITQDDYEKIFMEGFEKLENEIEAKRDQKKILKKKKSVVEKKAKKEKRPPLETDMERWLRAFDG